MASSAVGPLKISLRNAMNRCVDSKIPHTVVCLAKNNCNGNKPCIYYFKTLSYEHRIVHSKLCAVLELTPVIIVYPTQTLLSL